MPVARLSIEATRVHRGWDHAALASDGRVLLCSWGTGAARYELAGKPLSLPRFEEMRVRACGDRFVVVGHPWQPGTSAELIVVGDGRSTFSRRGLDGHLLDVWLDGDRVAFVTSDRFQLAHGVGVVEGTLGGKLGPVRTVAAARSTASLHAVMLRGKRRYVLAAVGDGKQALLDGTRTVFALPAHEAVFAATGEHVVLYRHGAPLQLVAIDGTKLATLSLALDRYAYLSLAAATPGRIALRGYPKRGERTDIVIVETSPWPTRPA